MNQFNFPSSTPSLDIFSVKAMALVTILAVSLVTLSAWKINERIAGMRLFTLGLLSLSLGGVVGLARVVIPGSAVMVICNVFMLAGMITVVQALRAFRGFPPVPPVAVAGLATVVSVFYLKWLFGQDNFGMRVAVISAAFALLSIDAAASMFRHVPTGDRAIYWPTGFAFGFSAAYLATRTVGAFWGAYGTSLFLPVPVEVASTICGDIAFIGCAFGMLIASNAQLRQETEKMALVDPLTGLPNRRAFSDRLWAAEDRALATNRKFGLIYLDLDDFKLINDVLGHDAGDDLLRSLSVATASMLRSGDCFGRIGGDEFVVLVEDVQNHGEIEVLARRLKATIENQVIPNGSNATLRVSCGVALFPDDGVVSAHDAMRQADAAMYREKKNRRIGGEILFTVPPCNLSPERDRRGRSGRISGEPTAETADIRLQRRKSDQSRKAARPPKRRFRLNAIAPTILRRGAASPRVSWANPLSWIGY